METEASLADVRDAGLWRELEGLLGSDGVAPSVEDVRDLVARVKSGREASHVRLPSRV